MGAVFGAGGAAIVAVATGVVGEAEAALAGFGSDFAGVDSASVFDFPFDASVSGALRFNRRMALVWLMARTGSASAISSSTFSIGSEEGVGLDLDSARAGAGVGIADGVAGAA